MKIVMSTLAAALILGTGLAQSDTFVNHYDAMLTGSPDSDGGVELRDYQPRMSLPEDFVPSVTYTYAGSPDDDGTLTRDEYISRQSLPPDFVSSVDVWNANSLDADGTVLIRPNGKACALSAADKGIC